MKITFKILTATTLLVFAAILFSQNVSARAGGGDGGGDLTAPIITLNGDVNVRITTGDIYTDAGATCTDDVDSTCSVVTVNNVDTSTPGTYTVTYNAQDDAGNGAIEVARTVIVEKKASHKSSSRRLSRAQVNQIFGTPTATTTTTSSSSSTVQQIQTQLITLLTQLIAMMKG